MKEIFTENGIILSQSQVDKFEKYIFMLKEYSAKMNLTAITERKEIITKHFLDCALFCDFFAENSEIIDIGSGAGFPGVVLAILRPDLSVTLLDSVGKKTDFLSSLCKELEISANIVNCRVEDYTQGREKFDVVTARAVAPLSTLLEYGAPLLKVGGKLAFYKTPNQQEKWQNSAEILGLKRQNDLSFTAPQLNGERRLIIFDKVHQTPSNFPRRSNKPRKTPLF